LKLVERNGWEFATRHNPVVVVLVAWTEADELVLVEQYREPIGRFAIELPAGLVGDIDGQHDEPIERAGERELLEETGFRARAMREIMRCPTSAGMSDETAVFLAAEGVERVAAGGGDGSEEITVHVIGRDRIDAWLWQCYQAGKSVDSKIYTALHWRIQPPDAAAGLRPGSGATADPDSI
jgi:ADP-ribose pyrophosphatase